MKRNLSHLWVPFPVRLMSSARTASQMGLEFAREIKNLYMQQGGAGFKRNGVTPVGNSILGEKIESLMHFVPVNGQVQILATTNKGKIYLHESDGAWALVYSGLNVAGHIRWAHYAGKLIMCNGTDPVMSWNGSSIETVHEYVDEFSPSLTFVNANTFTIESDATLYPVGKELKFENADGTEVLVTVASAVQNNTVTTITVNESVLTVDISKVSLKEYPPRFNYVYAAHDRLWGVGTGTLKAKGFSESADRSFVFYTDGVGDERNWRDESGSLQYINIADKMPVADEVVAMAVKDGMTVFFGRNYIQIWSGYDPTETGDMSWNKTIPLGLVHGDLVVEMPNDIAFFTRFGVRTLTRVLQTEQLDVSDLGSEMDTSITAALKKMRSSDEDYKKAIAFQHSEQGWFGFKPADESFIFQLSSVSSGWSIFDGAFKNMTAALYTPDGQLYLAIGGQLYLYDEDKYDDDGQPIYTKWWTPWLQPNSNGKRWANKYLEVIVEQGGAIPVTCKRFKNYNNSTFIETAASENASEDFWDESNWDEAYWDYGAVETKPMRDHYVADVLSYSVETNSTRGPFTIYGLKLFGMKEK